MEENKIYCSHCGALIEDDDYETVNGDIVCTDCYENHTTTCDRCGSVIWTDDSYGDEYTTLCSNCYHNHYTRCSCCDALLHEDDAYHLDGYDYCSDCYHDEVDKNRSIHDYGYKPEPIFYGDSHRYFGVELEIDGAGKDSDNADEILAIANKDEEHIYIKGDGSLDDGMELVTHPMSLDYHKQFRWEEIMKKAIYLGYRSHQTSTCGLHVHVNRDCLGDSREEQDETISKILYFVEHHWNELLKFSRRSEYAMNRWAARYGFEKTGREILDKAKKGNNGRYAAVNLMNYATIEFRMFRGTLKYNTFIAVLELVNEIIDTAIHNTDASLSKLSWLDFVSDITEPELIQYLKERKHKQKKLANFILIDVRESEEYYQVKFKYSSSSRMTEEKKLDIPKQTAANQKELCRFIQENGIPCEGVNGNVIFALIVHKAVKIETPHKAGWNRLNGKPVFATKETLVENDYPLITDKSFDVNGNADETPMKAVATFCKSLSAVGNVRLVFFFVMVRMMGILTGVFASIGIRFMRFIAADIDSDKLCRLLQVYDRDTLMDTLSVDQKKLDVVLSDKHDEVVVFNDKVKNKKDATAIVNALYRRCYKDTASELVGRAKDFNLSNDFLVVLASGFLGSLLRPEQVLHVSCTEEDFNTDADMNIFQRSNIGIDRMLIKLIMNEDGITEFIRHKYEHYKADEAVKDKPFANDYAALMSVYALLEKLTHGYAELPVSEDEMRDYLTETFISSMMHEQLTGIMDEFRKVLNDFVMSGKIVLMKAKFKEVSADTAASQIICCEDGYMYIANETFDRIVSLMDHPDNANQVRKAIKSYLKCSKSGSKETYKFAVRTDEGHKKVTAVSTKMLSTEASLKIRERVSFVINTDDGIERIHIGSDTQGQKYYWSIGHEDAAKSHLVLTGKTRMGKTCAMNYVAKQLYNNGHQVVYINFKNGDPKSNLLKHGYNQQEIDENFVFIPIKDMAAKDIELPHGKIVVFYCSKFCDMVEDIAQKIYDYISDESEREAFVVIDEAHNLSHSKESAMYYMYNMGAGNCIHLIASYQTFSELKTKEVDIIQGDLVICFKATSVDDGTKTAERYGQRPFKEFGRELANLKKQQCYLIGELENSDGEIENPPAVMVKIPKVD